jgi:huntingtin interacting protein 1
MSGHGKLTELSAAANEIAAANTQLVVASRVKANRDSEKLKLLENAAKQVNQCVSNVVEASRVCAELIDQQADDIDISTLSLHQTKKLELETQVKLLELEQELNKERSRLGLLRRTHYEEEEAQIRETPSSQTPNESKA